VTVPDNDVRSLPDRRAEKLGQAGERVRSCLTDLAEVAGMLPVADREQLGQQASILIRLSEELHEAAQPVYEGLASRE
jgi:hypothetical protein